MQSRSSSHGRPMPGRLLRRVAQWCLPLALVASGCGTSSQSSSSVAPVVFGEPAALTGAGAQFGVPESNAMQLAVDTINAAGGIKSLGGAKLKLVLADDQSDPTRDTQLLQQMATQGVSAFVGPFLSAQTIANIPTITRLKIPFLQSNFDDRVTQANSPYVFRIVDRADHWSDSIIDFIQYEANLHNTPIHKIGIVSINVPPGTSLSARLKSRAQALGWDVTEIDYDQKTTLDFTTIVAKLAAAKVDVITGYQNPQDGELFAKAFNQQSWRPTYNQVWIAGAQQLISFMGDMGPSVNDWLDETASAGADTGIYGPEAKTLALEYESKYKQQFVGIVGTAVAGIALLADAVDKAKSRDPQKVTNALASLEFSDYKGSKYPYFTQGGGVKFSDLRDNTAWVSLIVKLTAPGTQTVVYPTNYASAAAKWPLT